MRLRYPAVHDGMHQRWNVSLLWSLVLDLVEAGPGQPPFPPSGWPGLLSERITVAHTLRAADLARQRTVVEAYNRFVEKVIGHQLDQRAFAPTLLDVRTHCRPSTPAELSQESAECTLTLSAVPGWQGKAVNALLPFTKSSPAMPRVLDLIMRFQLAHPDATQADVERYLLEEERQDELRRMVEEARPAPKGKKRKDPAAQ